VTSDASAGEIKVQVNTPAGLAAAYLYTCYDATITEDSGSLNGGAVMIRLLTNWPNVDPQAGVQAYSSNRVGLFRGSGNFSTAPIGAINALDTWVTPNMRFMLLFDPRPAAGAITIMEMKIENLNIGTVHSFEAWGYFWDRSVLQAPGGPRHPGSS
jgi:hypothetical protein